MLVLAADVEAAGYEDERAAAFYQQLLERVRNVPGVAAASLSMYPPLSGGDGAWTQNVGIDGAPPVRAPAPVYFNTVSPHYFRTTGMTLLRGRDIARRRPRRPPCRWWSSTRRWRAASSPGRIRSAGRSPSAATRAAQNLQIVGVVSDAKYQRLQEEPRSVAYLPWLQQRAENMFVELRAGSPAAVADAVRREARSIDAVVPVHLQTVAERIRESLVTERVLATLAALLACAAAALACAGLYGLLAYGVARQTREIGAAPGARRRPARRDHEVLTDSLVLDVHRRRRRARPRAGARPFRARTGVPDRARRPVSIAAAAVLMLVVAGPGERVPAWRAARVDPVVALKNRSRGSRSSGQQLNAF